MLATSLVLCAAVLHATWNTLVKFSSDRLLVVACMDVVGVLCAILLLPFVSLPPAEVWPWLLGATVLQLLYRVLLIEAYKVGDLGLVYPLMRGLSPLVVLGLTLAFGGEQLSGRQILGAGAAFHFAAGRGVSGMPESGGMSTTLASQDRRRAGGPVRRFRSFCNQRWRGG